MLRTNGYSSSTTSAGGVQSIIEQLTPRANLSCARTWRQGGRGSGRATAGRPLEAGVPIPVWPGRARRLRCPRFPLLFDSHPTHPAGNLLRSTSSVPDRGFFELRAIDPAFAVGIVPSSRPRRRRENDVGKAGRICRKISLQTMNGPRLHSTWAMLGSVLAGSPEYVKGTDFSWKGRLNVGDQPDLVAGSSHPRPWRISPVSGLVTLWYLDTSRQAYVKPWLFWPRRGFTPLFATLMLPSSICRLDTDMTLFLPQVCSVMPSV